MRIRRFCFAELLSLMHINWREVHSLLHHLCLFQRSKIKSMSTLTSLRGNLNTMDIILTVLQKTFCFPTSHIGRRKNRSIQPYKDFIPVSKNVNPARYTDPAQIFGRSNHSSLRSLPYESPRSSLGGVGDLFSDHVDSVRRKYQPGTYGSNRLQSVWTSYEQGF